MLSGVGVVVLCVCVTASGDNVFSYLKICRNLHSDAKESNLYITTGKKKIILGLEKER